MKIAENLKVELLFRVMASNTSMTGSSGNTCLDIGINFKIDHLEDEGDAKAASVELLDRDMKRGQVRTSNPL